MAFSTSEVHTLLNPTSVALVGASENSGWAQGMADNLLTLGFEGRVHMVNPKRDTVFGLPCHPSISAIPDTVDHALVVAPAGALPDILEDVRESGVRGVTVIASGFQEAGPAGAALAQRVKEYCEEHRIALVGPNCYGFANYFTKAFVTRNSLKGYRPGGPIAMASQSGGLNLGTAQLAYLRGVELGFIVSSGNELVVDSNDYYDYFLSRDDIRVIGGTLERIPDPDRFADIATRARELGKPIVLLKLGRSAVMQQMSIAHTGAVAGSDVIVDTLLRDLGVIRVDSLEELVDTAGLLAEHGWPRGGRTFSVAISGGNSGLIADTAEPVGLELPEIEETVRARISDVTGLPPMAVHNPVDATTEGIPHLNAIFDAVSDPERHDIVLLNTISEPDDEALAAMNGMLSGDLLSMRDRGVYIARWTSTQSDPTEYAIQNIRQSGIPWLRGRIGLQALGNVAWYGRRRGEIEAETGATQPPLEFDPTLLRPGTLSEWESKEIVKAAGIPVPVERLATTAEEAVAAAEEIGYPVVVKLVSPDIAHKSEAGAVIVGLDDAAAVRAAYDTVIANGLAYRPGAAIDGVLVGESLAGAAEFFIGVTSDEAAGQIVVAGLGGVYVELLRDVVAMTPPVSPARAKHLLGALRSAPILAGVRGRPALDLEAFAEAVAAVSRLAADYADRIVEIDINPLFVLEQGKGVRAADALVVLRD